MKSIRYWAYPLAPRAGRSLAIALSATRRQPGTSTGASDNDATTTIGGPSIGVLGAIVANGLSRLSPQLFSRIDNALIGIAPKHFKPLQSQSLSALACRSVLSLLT
jgi:hypothetical protein